MRLSYVTRIPSPGFPSAVQTEDAHIDRYLQALDAALLGAKCVRMLTLEEVRDHLLEHRDRLIEQGMAADIASQEAVKSFGAVEEHASLQRSERTKLYFKMLASFGGLFAGLMLLMQVLNQGFTRDTLGTLATVTLFNFLFYGALMSWWFTFGFAQARPTVPENVNSDEELRVYSGRWSKIAAVFLFFVMGSIGIACLLSFVGIGFMTANESMIVNGILAFFALSMTLASRVAFEQYHMSGSSLTHHGIFGQRHINLARVRDFKRQSPWKSFFYGALGQQYLIVWEDDAANLHKARLTINGEMHNGDRLIAELERKFASSEQTA